ncbi:hypothetical protein [Nocardia gipuzkoensis]
MDEQIPTAKLVAQYDSLLRQYDDLRQKLTLAPPPYATLAAELDAAAAFGVDLLPLVIEQARKRILADRDEIRRHIEFEEKLD